jgi:hypothetical protein
VEPAVLTLDQVAAECQVAPADVRRWIREGRLRAFPVGSAGRRGTANWRVRREWLDAALEAMADSAATVTGSALAARTTSAPAPPVARVSVALTPDGLWPRPSGRQRVGRGP